DGRVPRAIAGAKRRGAARVLRARDGRRCPASHAGQRLLDAPRRARYPGQHENHHRERRSPCPADAHAGRGGTLMRAATLVAVALLGLTGCATRHPVAPAATPLRVAVSNTPPYAFREGGQLVGLEVDFARELASALGRPLDIVDRPFEDLIPAVRDRRVDMIMSGLTITRARQVQIAFSDPYLRSGLVAVMRREDVPRFKTAQSVLRTTEPVGVVSGTTAERFVRERAPGASVSVYPAARAAID